MKKKIGFIDLFIDEWHANNYPNWFKTSNLSSEFEVSLAWEQAPAGGKPLNEWCQAMGITAGKSIEQVVENCDVICILAPSNPEVHEHLAQIPLRSGKPVYIDKPFAPDRATAERLFELADKFDTPLMSSSALRFGTEILNAKNDVFLNQKVLFAGARGGGRSFEEYSIHQVEMIVSLMGIGAKHVMQCGNQTTNHMVIDYDDDRRATITLNPGIPFAVSACGENNTLALDKMSDYFPNLINAMLEFFSSRISPVKREETIEIAAIVASGIEALKTQKQWIKVK
ncbi:MAG TPA: oxidoreductase [Lentisphaeria bacterium]|nr:MAG: hypothetical protein A2X48_08780 [Lentisphaerae bacterium GWF2_49_21]HBC89027.1 oxidoreductase [Lentisphaeria bacterium]